MKKWLTHSYNLVNKSIVFKHFQAKRSANSNSREGLFDVLECTHWINIVAFNTDGKMILVKQYRHGIDDITLEGPAGVVDLGEEPLSTAKRELKEETGFQTDDWTHLGKVSANPAFQNNYCDIFLAKNCEKVSDQNLDEFEEIEVELLTVSEVKKKIENGEIHHSLFIAALGLYQLKPFSFD